MKNLTFNGNVKFDASQKKFGNSSFYFDGSSYITIPDSDDWNFGAGDFTIDFWIRFNDPSVAQMIFSQFIDASNRLEIYIAGGELNLSLQSGGALVELYPAMGAIANTWYHVALVRNGSNFQLYKDGIALGSSGTYAGSCPDLATPLYVGIRTGSSYPLNGYVDSLRVTKGLARWTSTFTPPTERAKSDQYTVLLLHGEGDYSNSSKTLTTNGTPATDGTTVPNSLFQGSMKFNGSTDYISIPDSSDWDFSGDFTVEGWVNFATVSGTVYYIVGNNDQQHGTGGWGLARHSGGFIWFEADGISISCSVDGWLANTWHHVALVRSGSSIKMYGDGVQMGSDTYSSSITSSNALQIGRAPVGNNYNFNGYMAGIKVSKGVARYIANFTPPDSPNHYQIDGNDGYTKLLISSNNTDGSTSFVDSSYSNNTVTPNGGVQHKTSVFKFDPSSILLNGTTDYLNIPDIDGFNLANSNFTIDFWINFSDVSGIQYFCSQISEQSGSSNNAWAFRFMAPGLNFIYSVGGGTGWTEIDFSWAPSINTWYHVALVQNGTNIKAYINGTQVGSSTRSDTIYNSSRDLLIGTVVYSGGYYRMVSGYMSEIRISKGIARWTSNFTPPTKKYNKLKIDTNTKLLIHGNGADASTNIVDSGTTGHVITVNGTAQIKTDKYRFYPSSMWFDGNSDYLTILDHDDWNFGAGDFTIDCWVRFASTSSTQALIVQRPDAINFWQFYYNISGSNDLVFNAYSGSSKVQSQTCSWIPTINQWYHIAFVKSSGAGKLYIDGVSQSLGDDTNGTMPDISYEISIGAWSTYASGYFGGYLQEIRISKGIARWTSNFAPPEKPYGLWF